MKRLLVYLKPYKWRVIAAFFLLIFSAGLTIFTPFLVKIAVDNYIAHKDVDGLNLICLIYLGVLIGAMVLSYLQIYLMQMTGQKIMYDMRMQIFKHVQSRELNFFHKNPVGRIMTRITNDVDVLNELFTSGVVSIFGDIFTLLGITIAMLIINFKLALVTLSVIPLLFLVTTMFRRKARAAYSETRYWRARINAFLQEAISGMSIIQLFGKEEKMFKKFDHVNHNHYQGTL